MSHTTDRELIKEIIEGRENAFTIIYNKYRPLMYKIAYKKFCCKQEAEDVIHEILSSLWQRRRLLSDKLPLKNYLIRAINLQFAHRYRHLIVVRRFEKDIIHLGQKGINMTSIENKEILFIIRSALDKIKAPSCRKIFELAYLEEQSCHEIALQLKIKPQVVRNQTCRALKVLREYLHQVV